MALKEMAVPESPKLYTKKYQGLLGVDYSCDVTEVDQRRTPTGTNMISDEGANPVKRLGWRVISSLPSGAGEIVKMVSRDPYEDDDENVECYIYVVAEHGVYEITRLHYNGDVEDPMELVETLDSEEGKTYSGEFVFYGGELYLFMRKWTDDSADYRGYFRIITKHEMTQVYGYTPEAVISRRPNGTGGASLEPINIIDTFRYFYFLGDSTSLNYYFYPSTLRSEPEYQKIITSNLVVEELTDDGWVELTRGTDYTFRNATTVQAYGLNKQEITVGIADAVIQFSSAKPPLVVGQDNIRVKFRPMIMKHTYDETIYDGMYKEVRMDLFGMTSGAIYGHTTTDRMFVVGGINKNRVYYSAVNDPTYFPDTNYVNVGYDTNEVKGLVRVSDSLAAIKSDSIYDNTLYLIRGSFLDENMVFTVIPTSAKLGALNAECIKTLIDEPLFLTRSGVFGIANTYVTSEKTIKSRSRFVDRKMLKEYGIENACATVWNKYYILCVNDHCYILDGRKYTGDATGNTDYQYEAYYWEGIPAKRFVTYKDSLFFGTEDGKICMFNTDVSDRTKYCDNGIEVWADTGETHKLSLTDTDPQSGEKVASEIYCEWSTPLDDDGAPQYFKTLNKKGNLVTLLPQTKTSADVTLVKDGVQWKNLERFWANIFDWAAIDFAEFPFISNITARDDFVKKKVKKYKRLQIVISNSGMFEPFGLLGITKTYYYGNFAK